MLLKDFLLDIVVEEVEDDSLPSTHPLYNRCPSTASTPTESLSSSPAISPRQYKDQSSDSESEVEEFDLDYINKLDWSDCDKYLDDDVDTCSECTDDEIIEGTGVPIDEELIEFDDEEDEYDSTDLTRSSQLADSYFGALSLTDITTYRVRHRPLGDYNYKALNTRDRWSWRDTHHVGEGAWRFLSDSTTKRLLPLQIASSNACQRRPASNTQSAARDLKTRPVESPYFSEKKNDPKNNSGSEKFSKYSNGKSNKKHQLARRQLFKATHSLSSPNRPAMVHARSAAHRLVLKDRAARKQQLKHASATFKVNRRPPKHLRTTSAPSNTRVTKTKSAPSSSDHQPKRRPVDSNARTVKCTGFEEFRYNFYLKYRAQLENALSLNYGSYYITGVRFCPTGSEARSRFMRCLQTLRPREDEVPLVFHGTHLDAMDSICRKGLLVPEQHKNGVTVRNGSALGLGIYSSKNAATSTCYARGTSTMFVCAAITTGAHQYQYNTTLTPECVVSGDVVVLMKENRICPLFLIDFADIFSSDESGSNHNFNSFLHSTQPPRFSIPRTYARLLLRKLHKHMQSERALHCERRSNLSDLLGHGEGEQ